MVVWFIDVSTEKGLMISGQKALEISFRTKLAFSGTKDLTKIIFMFILVLWMKENINYSSSPPHLTCTQSP
jgi:hypothetical protein